MTAAANTGGSDLSYPCKRLVDLVATVLAAPVAIPLMAVCAILVRITSRGPIIFRQTRVGHLGESFTLLKLRTMVDAPEGNPIVPDPTRITAVGRWLRRLSLDELPQLFSIARGEMSIVGPRPPLPYQVDRYDERQRQRLRVRPGLTGLAQVRGRNGISWSQRIEYDLEYIEAQSPRVDLKVMVATLGAVLRGAGVEGHAHDDPISSSPA
jgi:lipopolysaccharide/colanic/teichoic acid biosynthesis glycosyltransferase